MKRRIFALVGAAALSMGVSIGTASAEPPENPNCFGKQQSAAAHAFQPVGQLNSLQARAGERAELVAQAKDNCGGPSTGQS